jgi:hypothetical protein
MGKNYKILLKVRDDKMEINFLLCAMYWRILQRQIPSDSKVKEEYTQIEQEGLELIESKTWKEVTPYILGMMVATGFNEVKKRPFWDELPEDIKTELEKKFPDALIKSRVAYQEYLSSIRDQRTSYQKNKDLLRNQPVVVILLLNNYIAFLKSLRHFRFFLNERKCMCRVGGKWIEEEEEVYKTLSIIIRKLSFPLLTEIKDFDDHNTWNAEQKLDRIRKIIPPEVMEQLTDLDKPFPFESELPPKPVVEILQLKNVTPKTLSYELNLLHRNILSALFTLLTKTGITPVHTGCDNQRYEGCFEGLCTQVEKMIDGVILPNNEVHWAFQHCRNHHGCPSCRALCARLTIKRYPSNPNISNQICRCVWHGSIFAELAMRDLLLLKLGPTCALAQVVNNPESPHRAKLIELLTEMGVQEKPEEKTLREKQDAEDRQIKLDEFNHHDHAENVLNDKFMRHAAYMYGLGLWF